MRFQFYRHNAANELRSLLVDFDRIQATIEFENGVTFHKSMVELAEIVQDYNEYSIDGSRPIFRRRLFTDIVDPRINKEHRSLLRTFAVVAMFLHIDSIYKFDREESYIEFANETARRITNDFSVYEKTGDLGPQPTVYFLKRETIEANRDSIEHLYSLGLLERFVLTTTIEIETYYMPFEVPEISGYKILLQLGTWSQIKRERNAEIRSFIEGKRR